MFGQNMSAVPGWGGVMGVFLHLWVVVICEEHENKGPHNNSVALKTFDSSLTCLVLELLYSYCYYGGP